MSTDAELRAGRHRLRQLLPWARARAASGGETRCVCGWRSGGHFSPMLASLAFRAHLESEDNKKAATREGGGQ